LKTILAALAGASILAAPLPVLAQTHDGGGGFHGGGGVGGFHGGGFHGGPGPASIGGYHPGGGVRPGYGSGTHYGYGAGRYAGGYHGYSHYRGYGGYRGYPYFAGGLGLGIALGLSASYDPWYYDYYDAPFYGYSETVTVENDAPPPPVYDAAPPAAQAAPAACGSWSWDAARQVYNWIPC
jgi:hypothetical protein